MQTFISKDSTCYFLVTITSFAVVEDHSSGLTAVRPCDPLQGIGMQQFIKCCILAFSELVQINKLCDDPNLGWLGRYNLHFAISETNAYFNNKSLYI